MAARLDIRDTTAISFIYERKREKEKDIVYESTKFF